MAKTISGFVITLLLVGLFALALINGGIMIAQTNGANQSIADDPRINSYAGNISDSLDDASTDANESITSLSESSITLTSGFPVFDAISGLWKTLIRTPVLVWNLTLGFVFENLLGSAYGVVLGTLGAILLITILFLVWKMVSTGQGI